MACPKHLGTIELPLSGLGVIVYSPEHVEVFEAEGDYFDQYTSHAGEYLREGSIVGFNTGERALVIRVFAGEPEEELSVYQSVLQLGIKVTEDIICFADCYWLMEWDPEFAQEHTVRVPSGIYKMTVACRDTEPWLSGMNETGIEIYLSLADELPRVQYSGVPFLCG